MGARGIGSSLAAQGLESSARAYRQDAMYGLMEEGRKHSHLPRESVALVVPKNNSVKPLEKLEPPPERVHMEEAFARSAAQALGMPLGMVRLVLQRSLAWADGATGRGTTAAPRGARAGATDTKCESAPIRVLQPFPSANCAFDRNQRILSEACLKLNQELQGLLRMTYGLIYRSDNVPTFMIPMGPNLPYEMLLPLFDAKLLSNQAYNLILEASLGFPMGDEALEARHQRHEAAHVKPDKAARS